MSSPIPPQCPSLSSGLEDMFLHMAVMLMPWRSGLRRALQKNVLDSAGTHGDAAGDIFAQGDAADLHWDDGRNASCRKMTSTALESTAKPSGSIPGPPRAEECSRGLRSAFQGGRGHFSATGVAAVIPVLVRSVALRKNVPRCIAVRSSTVDDIFRNARRSPERHALT